MGGVVDDGKRPPPERTAGDLRKDATVSYPLAFVCVFWGKKYRDYFLTYCLPSLLSPGNLPALKGRPGCKFYLVTTAEDWAAIHQLPLLRSLGELIELVFLEIAQPSAATPLQLHMTLGHRMAMRRMYEDRAYGSILAPDLIVSDGTVVRILELIAAGKKAIFAPALRFEMSRTHRELDERGLIPAGRPLRAEPRFLAGISSRCLHSEIQRFEWDSPNFCNWPVSVYWTVPDCNDLIVHTSSWAIVAGSYAHLASYEDKSLEWDTVDSHYIYEHFFRYKDDDAIHMVTDSDEMVFYSLTPESDLTFLPLQPRAPSPLQGFEELEKLYDLRRFCTGPVLDPFRRWAYTIPCHFHGGEPAGAAHQVARRSRKLFRRALASPSRSERNRIALASLVQLGVKSGHSPEVMRSWATSALIAERPWLVRSVRYLRAVLHPKDFIRWLVGGPLADHAPRVYRVTIATVHLLRAVSHPRGSRRAQAGKALAERASAEPRELPPNKGREPIR